MSKTITVPTMLRINEQVLGASDQRADVVSHSGEVREPQKPFTFYGVVFTWYESDVITATVRNLYAEGVDEVFLIDNCSPDPTVRKAQTAGATLYDTVHSERFQDELKRDRIADLITRTLRNDACGRSWWIFCDADEFPSSPDTGTLRQYIAAQDDAVRCIGGNFINHYPHVAPHNLPGFHPADCQFEALYSEDAAVYCQLVHDKHNLVRFDGNVMDVGITGSYHRVFHAPPLPEPMHGILIHHFPYRDPSHTVPRFHKLAMPDENRSSRLGGPDFYDKLERGECVHLGWYVTKCAYIGKMYDESTRRQLFTRPPDDWRRVARVFSQGDYAFNRWYSEDTLFRQMAKALPPDDHRRWALSWTMMYRDRETFLRVFEATDPAAAAPCHLLYAMQCRAYAGDDAGAVAASRALAATGAGIPESAALILLRQCLQRTTEPQVIFDLASQGA